jgi:ACS family hexuronate transporter-like MFS transporter
VLQTLGSYTPIFLFCSVAYLLALLVVHLLNPRWAPVTNLDAPPPPLKPLEPLDAR